MFLLTIAPCVLVSRIEHGITATVYHPVPEQTNEEPDTTASGAKINLEDPLSHRWIAVSRDLEELGFTFGQKVRVWNAGPYSGIWVVQDRMNKRWTKRIDFLIGEYDPIGKWENVTIRIVTE